VQAFESRFEPVGGVQVLDNIVKVVVEVVVAHYTLEVGEGSL